EAREAPLSSPRGEEGWMPRGVDLGIAGYDEAVEIGRGGFGVVYTARQAELDRTVAIKIVAGRLDDDARRRFDRERRAMGALSGHPHIVTIYASGLTADGQPYIVMEYLPGGSLADRLDNGPLPWREAIDIGTKLAGALDIAHGAGVLHRDIKPENVLVSAYGEPKLADFGIARVEGATGTRSGVVTASVVHAAPEVLEGKPASESSDVYSLASTIYALVAGSPAFARDTDESMLPLYRRIAADPVPDLRVSGVPSPVCAAIEHAMTKEPSGRTSSPNEFAAALRDHTTEQDPSELGSAVTAERAIPPQRSSTVTVDRPGRTRPPPREPDPSAVEVASAEWPQPAPARESAEHEWPRAPITEPGVPAQDTLLAGGERSARTSEWSDRSQLVVRWCLAALSVLLVLVLALAFTAVGWYARRTYFVDIDQRRVTVFKGVPGGLLGWDPTLQERTTIKVADLTEAERTDIEGGKRFSSRDKADGFIDRLDQKIEDREAASTTTTTITTTTVPPPPPLPA
ncbi:MAG: serine/threonine-protein kinase, partial [Microthrixaceae bacterium]